MFKFFKKKQDESNSNDSIADESIESNQSEDKSSLSWFGRLKQGLQKTRTRFFGAGLSKLFQRHTVDEELLEEIEQHLYMADCGVDVTEKIMDSLRQAYKKQKLADGQAVMALLREQLEEILIEFEQPLKISKAPEGKPQVILMVGVNGVGKTTTIGKLAHRYKQDGLSVMLAAGDTFRAAAVEQLQAWGERNSVPVIAQGEGADSASVVFDAFQSAKAKNIDVLICDTAGRLHTQDNLMNELAKVKRVLKKIDADAPYEVMLVLDATTGQNALSQAKSFLETADVSGISLTKLDGTAKGGILFAIVHALKLPLRFIGIGEAVDDLRVFSAHDFVEALLSFEMKGQSESTEPDEKNTQDSV